MVPSGYFNLAKILELTLNNGYDKRTGMLVGPQTGYSTDYKSFEDLIENLSSSSDEKVKKDSHQNGKDIK